MLILTRRVGESVIIGDSPIKEENIVLTVLGVRGHQVRLGVDAKKDTPVHREEIYQRIQKEKGHNDSSSIGTGYDVPPGVSVED